MLFIDLIVADDHTPHIAKIKLLIYSLGSTIDLVTRYRSRSKEQSKVSTSGMHDAKTPELHTLTMTPSSWTQSKAQGLKVTGWVKNADDCSVVGEAQGDQSSLDKFVKHLNSGPNAAVSHNVDRTLSIDCFDRKARWL